MKTETQLTAKLVRAGSTIAYTQALNLHGHGMQAAGWPDCYFSTRTYTGWVEFKGPETKLQTNQKLIIKNLVYNHTPAFIGRFLEQEKRYWKIQVEDWKGKVLRVFEYNGTDLDVFCAFMVCMYGVSNKYFEEQTYRYFNE